jgi:hypothetical protein
MEGDVHVERLVVGHRPADAELVGEVMPQPAAALGLDDAAFPSGSRARGDIPGIHAKPLQDALARAGELLDGVHDLGPGRNRQVSDEVGIGILVDAGLVSPEVDRNPVRGLVPERLEEPLSRRQGFLRALGEAAIFILERLSGSHRSSVRQCPVL